MRVRLAILVLASLPFVPVAATAQGLADLTREVAVTPITGAGVPAGTAEISIGVLPDGTKPSKEAMAKEFARRSRRFAEYPQTNIPGEMWLFSEMRHDAPKLRIPTSELLRVLKNRTEEGMGAWAQVYCPYWDKIGYIDTMQACAYRGVTSVDFSKVNFKMYTGGSVGFTTGQEEYNFPASPDWGDVANDPDRFKPDVKPVTPGGPQIVSTGAGNSGSSGGSTRSSAAPPRATAPPAPPVPVADPAPPEKGPLGTASAGTAPTPAPPATPAIGSASNRHKGELTLRGGKLLESDALAQIPPGAAVELLENDGAWCKVRYAGKEGFVRAYYLGLEKK